ncbi:hypothetical protein [Natronococcus roseus]|uniref:hypothetical protein n=1 Tax=Natronococcus roseus TaxID=1052014 RepID=UPI00374D6D83
MTDKPEIPATEENQKLGEFAIQMLAVFKENGLLKEDADIPHERAANILLSEIHDWYRSGWMDIETESFADYCERVQEANYAADDLEGRYSAD